MIATNSRLIQTGVAVAAMLGALHAGIISARFSVWPASEFARAKEFLDALETQKEQIRKVAALPDEKLNATRRVKEAKVKLFDLRATYMGYTAICPNSQDVLLLNMRGQTSHHWKSTLAGVFPETPHIKDPVVQHMVKCAAIHVYPNGDLLQVIHASADTPYGYGMFKLDKDSKVLWAIAENIHHDVYVSDNGNIYTLAHHFEYQPIAGYEEFFYPALIDEILTVSPEGTIIDRINLLEAFVGTPYLRAFRKHYIETWDGKHDKFDMTHTNSVMRLDASIAAAFPMFKEGDLLVSIKNMNMIAVLRPETRKVIWAIQGDWRMQHKAVFNHDGNIVLFDNSGTTGRSRGVMIDPATHFMVWEYSHNDKLLCPVKSSAQQLPNQNWMIVEAMNVQNKFAHVIELSPDSRRILWTLDFSDRVYDARRYAYEYFTPEFCDSIQCPVP